MSNIEQPSLPNSGDEAASQNALIEGAITSDREVIVGFTLSERQLILDAIARYGSDSSEFRSFVDNLAKQVVERKEKPVLKG